MLECQRIPAFLRIDDTYYSYAGGWPRQPRNYMRVVRSSRFCLSGSFLPYRPPRSNFNHSFFSRDTVTIAAPRPVFRSLDEASCDRITVDVFQLLRAFGATPY